MQWEKVAEVPDEWKEGLLIKLAKSGNLRECYNYRGIVQFLERCFVEYCWTDRMKTVVDAKLGDQQAAFRKDRSLLTRFACNGPSWSRHVHWSETLPSTSTLSTMTRLSEVSTEIHCGRL